MWCRAILSTIALTYIICVLIMNGLQKEDLDANTLKKLRRHNVNIDDMNNENARKECEVTNQDSSSSGNADDDKPELMSIPAEITDKNDQKTKLSDTNLQNIIINYFNNAQKSSKAKESDQANNNTPKPKSDLPNVENFMNLWSIMSKTKLQNETATETVKTSTVFLIPTRLTTKIDKKMEYINRILENFIPSQKITTTKRPTTKSIDYYDSLAKKLKVIIENSSMNQEQNTVANKPTVEYIYNKYVTEKIDEEVGELHNSSLAYIGKILKFANQIRLNKPTNINDESNINIINEDNNITQETRRRMLPNKVNLKKNTSKALNNSSSPIKPISEDVIKEISESIKTKVLQDLKNIITTIIPVSTITYTTDKPPTTTVKQIDSTTNVKYKVNQDKTDTLEKFLEFYQQFKAFKEITQPLVTSTVTEGNHLPLKIFNTPTQNMYVIPHSNPQPPNLTSLIINPYNPSIHTPVIQTILPNEPYALLNINHQSPIQNIPIVAKPEHKITQLNIFNTKNNYHPSPLTIQTNSIEVPPLGLPAQQSVVYQNIVVPMDHPSKAHHAIPYLSHTTHVAKHVNSDRWRYLLEQSKNHEFANRHERNRYYNGDYSYNDNRQKSSLYKDYDHIPYNGHNIERFHERLERVDDWPGVSRSREVGQRDEPKLVSRHQLPLTAAKKRSRYSDAHFTKFLKTQQKVNDMLERILATKNVNGPRSVETTV